MNDCLGKEYKKICAVIVTYGERGDLARRAAERCFEENLERVILIDNGSAESSQKKLSALAEKFEKRIKLVRLDRNTGSAGGFKRGLEEFYGEKDLEYVFLLDDDNLPSPGCVHALLRAYLELKKSGDSPLAVFASRKINGKFTQNELALIKSGGKADKNSFFGFNLLYLPQRLAKNLTGGRREEYPPDMKAVISVDSAPYGTLFFHKSVIDLIGYPMEELYLYMDDLEYTGRIKEQGGRIYLALKASAEEMEGITWKRKKWFGGIFSYLEGNSTTRIYYASRNVSFYEYHVLNRSHFNFLRSLNKTTYLVLIFCGAVFLNRLGNWFLILKAVRHGEIKKFSGLDSLGGENPCK